MMTVGKLDSDSPALTSLQLKGQRNTIDTNKPSNEKKLLESQEDVVHAEEVETVVEQMNGLMEHTKTNVKFMFHEDLEKYYVTIVNQQTDEVIKEIPPKKMLDMYAEMAEFMGLLIDKKI